ncbi:MAG: hypothetical protein HYY40_00055 [Bacteroidetes bacterium]|nr:hypothetical protein [Bacteroidota bacterium]
MKLKGGVIVIGSLIWEDHLKEKDNDFIRRDWRVQNLFSNPKLTPVPIRYGRKSSSRSDTYTMVFSKSNENALGQGLILEFRESINSFEDLERQAIALAIAEGIYTTANTRISSMWGSVGLLINPALKKINFSKFEFLKEKWTDIYQSYYKIFFATGYKCDEDVEPPINQNGMLTINWQDAMNDFDLLIATPVIPDPKRILSPREITDKMINNKYQKYFRNNLAHDIKTCQDNQILELLTNRG